MGKQILGRIQKTLAISLVVLFVLSVTATAINARTDMCNSGLKSTTKATVAGKNVTATKTTVVGKNVTATKNAVPCKKVTVTKTTVVGKKSSC